MPNKRPMNVCVVGGAGYVGLITGLGLAEIGHNVVSVDVDQNRVQRLQTGDSPVYENGIESLLQSNLDVGRIRFTTSLPEAVVASEIVFVAVGTPAFADGSPDLSQVIQVTEELAQYIDAYKLLVIKSTLPVGALAQILSILGRKLEEGKDFHVAVNPEFLQEGNGINDFFYPHCIVVGADSVKARETLRDLYHPIITGAVNWHGQTRPEGRPGGSGPVPLIETDPVSAQMIKYASNAFLATRISFINEVATLCDRVGADVKEVTEGIGYDPRIGHSYMRPGLGFGGPCLEKDLQALIHVAEGNGYHPWLLKAVISRNEEQKGEVITKLKELCGHHLQGKTVAVFGLAFKAGTNDVRNSLALNVIDRLNAEGAAVQAHDPVAISEAKAERPDVKYCDDPYEAASRADAILILTEWPCFNELDYGRIKEIMAFPRIVDGPNLLDPESLKALGFAYVGVGRR